MAKRKRKLTAAQKAEKKRRREEFMAIFIRGKMKHVPRPPTIEGMDVDEFIRRNADPIWLHQNEMWELMDQGDDAGGSEFTDAEPRILPLAESDCELPF